MSRLAPWLAGAGVLALAVTLVALTLRPAAVPTYVPTPPAPREAPRGLVGPVLYTVDATAADGWRHFSFRLGSVVDTPAGDSPVLSRMLDDVGPKPMPSAPSTSEAANPARATRRSSYPSTAMNATEEVDKVAYAAPEAPTGLHAKMRHFGTPGRPLLPHLPRSPRGTRTTMLLYC